MKNSIIYNGPSLIDGAPIAVIALVSTSNRKTGALLQTYVIRSDVHPMEASKQGLDYSICGTCKHRGTPTNNPEKKQAANRSCYVSLFQGPSAVYRAFVAGKYQDISGDYEAIAKLGDGRMVRLGTYGDPLAVPQVVWQNLLQQSTGSTGYTHQSGMLPVVAPLDNPLMVSADTLDEAREARVKGYRTFRVIPVSEWNKYGTDNLSKTEVLCPASTEGQPKSGAVQCSDCLLCNGNISSGGKSVAIVAHGIGKKYVSA